MALWGPRKHPAAAARGSAPPDADTPAYRALRPGTGDDPSPTSDPIASRLQLTWIDSRGERTILQLDEPELLIGRGHRCGLGDRDDPLLSRQHARLAFTEGAWLVVDCGSRNRTLLNGREVVASEAISPGDTLVLGRCRLIVGRPDATPIVDVTEPSLGEQTFRTLDVSGDGGAGTTRVLVEAARSIASAQPSEKIVDSLLRLALRATGAERGLVAVSDGAGGLTPVSWLDPTEGGVPRPSRTMLSQVLQQGKAVAIRDVHAVDDLPRDGSLIGAGVRSVLCAPLGPERPAHGILYLDRREGRAAFDDAQLQVVAVLAGMMHLAHENKEAHAHERRLQAVEAELAAAARMQEMLLPPADLVPPAGFRVAGWHEPCRDVGGDIYDFFLSGRGFGAMLADVSGKGLTAALLVASLHARWHAITQRQLPCDQVLAQLNEAVSYRLPPNRFITLAAAVVDPLDDHVVFASAGHGPVLLLHEGKVGRLESTGPPLGLFEGAAYECRHHPFYPGEALVLFSDGVVDQCDEHGEPFGIERLVDCAARAPRSDPGATVNAIVQALEEHAGNAEQDDDATIAVLARV